MVQRSVSEVEGLRPSITGGINIVVGSTEEDWETTEFPMLLCEKCQAEFKADRFSARLRSVFNLCGMLGLLAAFLWFAYHNAEIIAAVSGILWVIGALAWGARCRDTRRIDPLLEKWLGNIRWLPDAVDTEDEFKLRIGASRRVDETLP